MEIKIDYSDEYIINNEKSIYGLLCGEFGIGDKVKIKDEGELYSSYTNMAKAMNIEEEWRKLPSFDVDLKNKTGIVINRKIHEDKSNILYAVIIDNNIYIFGEGGLKLINKSWFKDEDFII